MPSLGVTKTVVRCYALGTAPYLPYPYPYKGGGGIVGLRAKTPHYPYPDPAARPRGPKHCAPGGGGDGSNVQAKNANQKKDRGA